MKVTIPALLSFNGGYVDTAGFLALQGLFTAHVTGNFVTFGAALVHGASGAGAKLLALPVFCAVVVVTRMVSLRLPGWDLPVLKSMLTLKIALLALAALFAVTWGPFGDGDAWQTIVTGMTLVAAMAIQNGISRIHLSKAPPSTLMTGTSTQMMIDIADLMAKKLQPKERGDILARLGRMGANVVSFALGCGAAALAFALWSVWVFLLPPLTAIFTLAAVHRTTDPDIA